MTETATYLDLGGAPAYAVVHLPDGPARATGVVLLSPYGWDDLTSYRSRRAWAVRLAAAGYPVLRFDWPGTGDSPGVPGDPGRLGAWQRAATDAADVVRHQLKCSQVAGIGIGIGGLIGALAGAAYDDLVLWGARAKGSAAVRGLRATAALHAVDGASVVDDDGVLWINGHPLPPELARDLTAVDLVCVPSPPQGRGLLLGTDGRVPDPKLEAALQLGGRTVHSADGPGWGDLLADPQVSRPPTATGDLVEAWLAERRAGAPTPAGVLGRQQVVLAGGVRESVLTLTASGGSLSAVLTEPEGGDGGPCVLLLNAGALRRIGPNRMYVDAARRWAAAGRRTVRVDLPGTGDSAGPGFWPGPDEDLYEDSIGAAVTSAIAAMNVQGISDRFIAVGLCSGAYWAFVAAAQDERVTGAVLLNPKALVWSPRQLAVESSRELAKLRSLSTWTNVLRGGSSVRKAAHVAAATMRRALWTGLDRLRRQPPAGELGAATQRLQDAGARALLVLTPGEILRERIGTDPGLAAFLASPAVDHVLTGGPANAHTLAPPILRHEVERAVDDWLLDLLRRQA